VVGLTDKLASTSGSFAAFCFLIFVGTTEVCAQSSSTSVAGAAGGGSGGGGGRAAAASVGIAVAADF